MRSTPWLLALAACAGPGDATPTSAELLAAAIEGPAPRLLLDGNEVVGIATPIDLRALPAGVRPTIEAIAPDGTLEFCAEEWGWRGQGYRVEKSYTAPVPHRRSVLVGFDGGVLERSHTLPLQRVPQHVLATALRHGTQISSAEIVSGPVREEFWRLLVSDRRGRIFVVRVDLEGRELDSRRRSHAVVEG